jgi:hypothetical protein
MSRIISLAIAALIAAVLIPVAANASSDRSSSRSSSTAGTVKSYTDGVLTIALKDGTEVSGKVTRKTDIECDDDSRSRSARSSRRGDDDKSGDDHNKGERGDDRSDGKRRGRGKDDCGDEALVAGAEVHKAKLKISSRGLAWDDVELRS